MTSVLADSSFFVALYNKREFAHDRCVEAYESLKVPLSTCEACVTEALHLLGHSGAAVASILASLDAGSIAIPFRAAEHALPLLDLMRKYRDTPADFADACLIHMANELNTGDILTLDSDFRHYRWSRNRRFRLLVPLD
jgi:predicted nucleic acid-binding protein